MLNTGYVFTTEAGIEMENTEKMSPQEMRMQGLLDRYLIARKAVRDTAAKDVTHLDEDSLAAFSEGNLSSREARPIISHLVDCSFCRHVTAEMVRLDLAFAGSEESIPAAESSEPSKVSEVLSGLLSRIFGTADGAVFAHNESDEEKEPSDKKDEEEDSK